MCTHMYLIAISNITYRIVHQMDKVNLHNMICVKMKEEKKNMVGNGLIGLFATEHLLMLSKIILKKTHTHQKSKELFKNSL